MIRYDLGMKTNINTSDSNEILTEMTVRVYGEHGYREYDLSDDGTVKALQQIDSQSVSASATDSWNVSRAEREAIKKNEGVWESLVKAAAQRRLKVRYSGIGGDYTIDYGSKAYDKYR
jgi:hypothetical protein